MSCSKFCLAYFLCWIYFVTFLQMICPSIFSHRCKLRNNDPLRRDNANINCLFAAWCAWNFINGHDFLQRLEISAPSCFTSIIPSVSNHRVWNRRGKRWCILHSLNKSKYIVAYIYKPSLGYLYVCDNMYKTVYPVNRANLCHEVISSLTRDDSELSKHKITTNINWKCIWNVLKLL